MPIFTEIERIIFRCPSCGCEYFTSHKHKSGHLIRSCLGNRGQCNYRAPEWDDHIHFVATFYTADALQSAQRRLWNNDFKSAPAKKAAKVPRQPEKKKPN